MSAPLTSQELTDLMAYADGEVDDETRQRVEALLAGRADAREVVASFGVLGDAVRSHVERKVAAAGPRLVSMPDDVLARIDAAYGAAHGLGRAQAAGVVNLAAARSRRGGMYRYAGLAVAVTAMAAGLLLLARPGSDPRPFQVNGGPLASGLSSSASSAAVAAADDDDGDHVEQVESEGQVSVFYVPQGLSANIKASSVVVWLNDEPAAGDQ